MIVQCIEEENGAPIGTAREVGEHASCARAITASGKAGYDWLAVAWHKRTPEVLDGEQLGNCYDLIIPLSCCPRHCP